MTYYIVFNEWNYPTESGREFVGDFDSSRDAEFATVSECENEAKDFPDSTVEAIVDKEGYCAGYIMYGTKDKISDYFFRSVIIEREV